MRERAEPPCLAALRRDRDLVERTREAEPTSATLRVPGNTVPRDQRVRVHAGGSGERAREEQLVARAEQALARHVPGCGEAFVTARHLLEPRREDGARVVVERVPGAAVIAHDVARHHGGWIVLGTARGAEAAADEQRAVVQREIAHYTGD